MKTDDLKIKINEVSSILDDLLLQGLDAEMKMRAYDAKKQEITSGMSKLSIKEKEIKEIEQRVKEEKFYILKISGETEKKREEIEEKEKKALIIIKESENKLKILSDKENIIEEKRKALVIDEEKTRDMNLKEKLLERERSMLNERKQTLDFKEKELNLKAERLQRMM